MPIHIGGSKIGQVFFGSQPIKEVYAGSLLVWSAEKWDFEDDFERSSIGTAEWSGSGGLIAGTSGSKHLKKNSSAGSADYWTVRQFDTDNIEVEAVLGPVDSGSIRAAIILGNPQSTYVYVEFQVNGGTLSHYTGSTWQQFASVSAKPGGYTQGDVVVLKRTGSLVQFIVNGQVLGSGTSSYGWGVGNRRVALTVRSAVEFITMRYGPTFDRVRIRAN